MTSILVRHTGLDPVSSVILCRRSLSQHVVCRGDDPLSTGFRLAPE